MKQLKKIKILVASLTTITIMPLTSLVSCNQNITYMVILATDGQGGIGQRSITDVPSGTYLNELEDQIHPRAADGWRFDRLNGYYVNGSVVNPDEYQITSDVKITVKFTALEKYTITLNKQGQGSISQGPITNVPVGTYLKDLKNQINPQPDEGWDFVDQDGYYIDGQAANPDEYQIASDVTITIKFTELEKCTITLNTEGEGEIAVSSIPDVTSGTYLSSLEEIINPQPSDDIELGKWYFDRKCGYYVNGEIVDPDKYKITGDINITVKFIKVETANDGTLEYWIYKSYKEAVVHQPYDTAIETVIIPVSVDFEGEAYDVVSLNRGCFGDTIGLANVTFAEGSKVTTIGDEAFKDRSKLTTITIPQSVKTIGVSAFEGCSGLTDASGPDDSYGFEFLGTMEQWKNVACRENWHKGTKATQIQCSDGICDIYLTPYTISGGARTLNGEWKAAGSDVDPWVVKDSAGEVVPVALSLESAQPFSPLPDWIKIDDYGKVYWTNEASEGTYIFKVKANFANPIYTSVINLTINVPTPATDFEWSFDDVKKEATLTKYIGTSVNVFIPMYVRNNEKIYTVTSIGTNAFVDTEEWHPYSVVTVTIPSSVVTIGYRSFWMCFHLASINIPDSVTTIENAAFDSCESLTSIKIGRNVTHIGQLCFQDCYGLTTFTISASVTYIGAFAFRSCRALSNTSGPEGSHGFNFLGTIETWKTVDREPGWLDEVQATEIQCIDGVCGLNDK